MAWIWVNLVIGAVFVLAISGIPLWLVLTRPDTGPKPAELAAWRRWWAAVGRHHHQRAIRPYATRRTATRKTQGRRLDGRPATER
jgi:hypothetical protein